MSPIGRHEEAERRKRAVVTRCQLVLCSLVKHSSPDSLIIFAVLFLQPPHHTSTQVLPHLRKPIHHRPGHLSHNTPLINPFSNMALQHPNTLTTNLPKATMLPPQVHNIADHINLLPTPSTLSPRALHSLVTQVTTLINHNSRRQLLQLINHQQTPTLPKILVMETFRHHLHLISLPNPSGTMRLLCHAPLCQGNS